MESRLSPVLPRTSAGPAGDHGPYRHVTRSGRVPEQYHNLAEAFSKAWATTLPLHRPYDCAIDLLLGTTLPKGIFTKLDLRNAYHLLRIREGDE